MGPKTRDSSWGWNQGFETRDPKGGTKDLRSGTLFYMGPTTQDSGHWKRDLRHLWWVRPKTQNKYPLSNLGRKNYDSNKLNQVSYKRIWLIIFLIFNHIIKATSKTWTQILDPDLEKPGTRKTWEIAECRKKIGRPHTVKKRLVSKLTEKIVTVVSRKTQSKNKSKDEFKSDKQDCVINLITFENFAQ